MRPINMILPKPKWLWLIYSIIAASVMIGLTLIALAAPGDLDLAFGQNGKVITAIETLNLSTGSVAITAQPDGKILIAGPAYNGNDFDFGLMRYTADGTVEVTFGFSGLITTPIGTGRDLAYDVALQSDGKILVGGYAKKADPMVTRSEIALVRYKADGSLDQNFGQQGIVTTTLDSDQNVAQALTLQPPDKILVAGYTYEDGNGDFALVRYTNSGALDFTFGYSGVVTTSINHSLEGAFDVVLQPDGKILLGGFTSENNGSESFALIRYTDDGFLDNTFGTGGIVTTIGVVSGFVYDILLQPDEKILITGKSGDGFVVLRYMPDGSLDNTFGDNGLVITRVSDNIDESYAVALQGDGKILLAGTTNGSVDADFTLIRYLSDGLLDPNFGVNGVVTTNIGADYDHDVAYDMLLQMDGKIVVAGFTYTDDMPNAAIVRYENDILSPTPTDAPIATETSTPVPTSIPTTTSTATSPATSTWTLTATPSPTSTEMDTPTAPFTATSSATPIYTPTITETVIATPTPTLAATSIVTPTGTTTPPPTMTATSTVTSGLVSPTPATALLVFKQYLPVIVKQLR